MRQKREEVQATDDHNEQVIDDGLGIALKKKTLFHGSSVEKIEKFIPAEETTVGNGIYFTSQEKDAAGYARRRSTSRKGKPVVYEVNVENIKLCDLRQDKNVSAILGGFAEKLKEVLARPDLKWNYKVALQNALIAIESGIITAGNLREVTFSHGELFSRYIQSLGYEGLITFEGGEGNHVGSHDTYLIFEADRVIPVKETVLEK